MVRDTGQEDLIAALKRRPNDRELWGEFYRRAWPRVYYSVYRRTRGDVTAAQDLAQEAFVRFLERVRIEKLVNEAHAIAYLCRTAVNLYFKRSERTQKLLDASDEAARALENARYDEDDRKQLAWDLEDLGSELDDSDQRLLRSLIGGLTLDEIAALDGIDYGTVAVRVHRLKKKLLDKSDTYAREGNKSDPRVL